MRVLDLFCGGGGASMGYHRAGFDVVGVDLEPQPDYPFTFVQADALALPFDLADFDLVHASPPCQAYSSASHRDDHPDMVEDTRGLLRASGVPWVIENVEGAPMWTAPTLFGDFGVVLCGSMFELENGRGYLKRHKIFESSFFVPQPPCRHPGSRAIGVYGHQGLGEWKHHMGTNLAEGSALMGVEWMGWRALTQAIPPAYTEYIGRNFMEMTK